MKRSLGLTDGDEDLADESDGDFLVDEEVDADSADEGDDPHDQVRGRGEQTVLEQNSTSKLSADCEGRLKRAGSPYIRLREEDVRSCVSECLCFQ